MSDTSANSKLQRKPFGVGTPQNQTRADPHVVHMHQ